jgi:hypothetical protein
MWLAKVTVLWDRTFVIIGSMILVFSRSFLLYCSDSSPQKLQFYPEDGRWKLLQNISNALPVISHMTVTFRSVLLNDTVIC